MTFSTDSGRIGTPGAAGRRGVPADRDAERGAELDPLFASLAETERADAEIRRMAWDPTREVSS